MQTIDKQRKNVFPNLLPITSFVILKRLNSYGDSKVILRVEKVNAKGECP
jgi:hypothetical protein